MYVMYVIIFLILIKLNRDDLFGLLEYKLKMLEL